MSPVLKKHALLLKGRIGSDKERPKGRVGSGSDNARGSTILNYVVLQYLRRFGQCWGGRGGGEFLGKGYTKLTYL